MTYNPLKTPFLEQLLPQSHSSYRQFTDPYLWLQSLLCCGVAILIARASPQPATEAIKNERYTTIEMIASAMSTLVAFLLGGFVSAGVAAWKERRTNYAFLIGACKTLLVTLSACVSETPGAPRLVAKDALLLRESRAILGRYVLLACELTVLKARGHLDSARGETHLRQLGLLAAGEWEAMVPGDRQTSVFCWVNSMAVALRRRGLLCESDTRSIADAVVAARAQSADLMASLSRDLPLPYANLVSWLTKLALGLQTLRFGVYMISVEAEGDATIYSIMGVFLYSYFFQALLGVQRVLHNPFLDRLIDVGHEPIFESLQRLTESLMQDRAFLPPAWLGGGDVED
jgi:hypothetical protein